MHNKVEIMWWGARVCLDESNTQLLLTAIDTGAGVAAIVTAVAPDLRAKVAVALAAALMKLGGTLIKSVDQRGGSNGVCISHPWVGPVIGWVRAQTV